MSAALPPAVTGWTWHRNAHGILYATNGAGAEVGFAGDDLCVGTGKFSFVDVPRDILLPLIADAQARGVL